jgi:hypothetical protein
MSTSGGAEHQLEGKSGNSVADPEIFKRAQKMPII